MLSQPSDGAALLTAAEICFKQDLGPVACSLGTFPSVSRNPRLYLPSSLMLRKNSTLPTAIRVWESLAQSVAPRSYAEPREGFI